MAAEGRAGVGTAVAVDEIRRSWTERGIGPGTEPFLAVASVLRGQRVMSQATEAEPPAPTSG